MKKILMRPIHGLKLLNHSKYLLSPTFSAMLLLGFTFGCKKNVTQNAESVNNAVSKESLQASLVSGHGYIAVGNSANSSLEVYDPDASNWNTPIYRFKPTTALGYTAPEAFTGPPDAKVRVNSAFPNVTKVMAVTDNKWVCLAVYEGTSPRGTKLWGKRWTGSSPDLHSGEVLPNGNIAIAAAKGNWVRVYNTTGSNYAQFDLVHAHAVTWDPKYNVLWTCGDTKAGSSGKGILTALIVGGTRTAPTLTEDVSKRDTTPGHYPHQVVPYYGDKDKLLVADHSHVYIYDKINRSFTTLPGAADRTNVKGISNQPDNSYLVETRPDTVCCDIYHTNTVEFYNPTTGALAKAFTVNGALFYKATCFRSLYQ